MLDLGSILMYKIKKNMYRIYVCLFLNMICFWFLRKWFLIELRMGLYVIFIYRYVINVKYFIIKKIVYVVWLF